MKGKGRGWHKESARHSLAAKGIKTKRQTSHPQRRSFYTCTSSRARAAAYRKGQVIVPGEVVSDPGDIGAGLYGDTYMPRTKFHGPYCFRITVDRSKLLYLEKPYSPDGVPEWLRDVLFTWTKERGWVMRTVQLPWSERIQAAKEVRDAVLAKGYSGLYMGSMKLDNVQHYEYAIFSNDAILSVD